MALPLSSLKTLATQKMLRRRSTGLCSTTRKSACSLLSMAESVQNSVAGMEAAAAVMEAVRLLHHLNHTNNLAFYSLSYVPSYIIYPTFLVQGMAAGGMEAAAMTEAMAVSEWPAFEVSNALWCTLQHPAQSVA